MSLSAHAALAALGLVVAGACGGAPDTRTNPECSVPSDCDLAAGERCCQEQCIRAGAICEDGDTTSSADTPAEPDADATTSEATDDSGVVEDTTVVDTEVAEDTTVVDTEVAEDMTVVDTAVAEDTVVPTDTMLLDSTSPNDTTAVEETDASFETDASAMDVTATDASDDADTSPGGVNLREPGIRTLGDLPATGGLRLIDARLEGPLRTCTGSICIEGGIAP